MKNTNKKGFTLVELLVVIAIVAILATVAIIGYTSFTNKANVSNDKTLVAQLNKAVVRVDGQKYANPHEAFEAVRAAGFDVAKIEATAKNNDILWDQDKGEFFYTEDGAREGNIWIVVSDESKIGEKFNTYYVGTDDVDTNTTSDFIVYTTGAAEISIKAPNAHVEHFGEAKLVDVKAVKGETYIENGQVDTLNIEQGRLVVATGATVATVLVPETATDVKVELQDNSTTTKLIVNAEVEIKVEEKAEVENIATGNADLLDKLEDMVVEGKENVNNDVIITEKPVTPEEIGDFAGGLGTKALPYLIATPEQMANISKYYDTYNYYKVADGTTVLDMRNVNMINLHGSFDGNGVQIINLTNALFAYVGYDLAPEEIKISNIDATMNITNGKGFVYCIDNSGTTTFENVSLHGYIEGSYNMGSFYNYGTGGADYTVSFVNAKSDMTLVCTTGNAIGGMLGHGYEGSAYKFTVNMDEKSGYTGQMYTTGTAKGYQVMGMCSHATYILNGVETSRYTSEYPSTKLVNVKPTVGEDGYYVAANANANRIVVSLNCQLSAYDDNGAKIADLAGITWVIDQIEITEDLDGKLFDLVESAVIVNGTDHEFGYTLEDGVLTIYTGRDSNYLDGNVTLYINQYKDNTLLSVGGITIYTFPEYTPAQ